MNVPDDWKPNARPKEDLFNFLDQEIFDLKVLENEYERHNRKPPAEFRCRKYCLETFLDICTKLEQRELEAGTKKRS